MIIDFGKLNGLSVEEVVLKHPDYVQWVIAKRDAEGPLLAVQAEINRLIEVFDAKAFTRKCYGSNCTSEATRFTAYVRVPGVFHFWCGTCNPAQDGADKHKLTLGRTYLDAQAHVTKTCNGTKDGYRRAIRSLAQAKGLPERCGDKEAQAFFA